MTKQFFFGMLVGVAVGSAVGLLLAPERGVTTRRMVSDAASSARNKITGVASGVAHKAQDAVGAIKQAI
ncbi:MAG: YtxH domain-containing protein [Armatimonadetes bacterium]|nr:YtxH domain-containing protein [Armatimonadota bacterium]